jgi:hypothetical protein
LVQKPVVDEAGVEVPAEEGVAEETKEKPERREKRERKEVVPEKVESEEEEGFTL